MSYWGSSSFGRWSPFTREPYHAPPEVRDSDYHYISEHDIVDPPSAFQPDYYGGARRPQADDQEPDVLTLKHRGQVYPLHFPPFSISESLRVATVRRNAADQLGVRDPRRIRLLYKGRQLKDDAAYTKEEGLKQNSELMCVVSESSMNGSLDSSEDESMTEEELRETERNGGVSLNPDGSRKGKRRKDKKKNPRNEGRKDPRGDGYYSEGTSRPQSSANLQPTPSSSARRPSPSPSPRPFDSSLPSATSASGPAQIALKQIADLENKYRRELAGPVEKLLANPPSDQKTRDYEVIKLTETIERDLLLKTDAIETDGRDDVRTKRKALVKDLQQVLSKLDALKKSSS